MATPKKPDDAFETAYVKPVCRAELEAAISRKDTDPGWQQMRAAEMEYIRRWRNNREDRDSEDPAPSNLAGLALSGGGIRSATFSLGIMQALAHRDVLKRMDYLSTVSGGGYIGSAISWLVSAEARGQLESHGSGGAKAQVPDTEFGMDRERFPFGTDNPAPNAKPDRAPEDPVDKPFQHRLLRYLRAHGYYLTPGKGVTVVSLLGVVLRGTLLNLLVWIPMFVMFFVFGLWVSGLIAEHAFDDSVLSGNVAAVAKYWENELPILPRLLDALPESERGDTGFSSSGERSGRDPVRDVKASLGNLLGFELFLIIGFAIVALLLVVLLIYSITTWFRRGSSAEKVRVWYTVRRYVEIGTATAIPVAVATLVIGSLPVIGALLHGWIVVGGPIAVLIGTAMTIQRFFIAGLKGHGAPSGIMVSIGAGLLLYGMFLVAYEITFLLFTTPAVPMDDGTVAKVLGFGALWTVVFGWCVNLNYISVHRYYRDRLMESFMPDINRALDNKSGQAVGADITPLHKVANPQDPNGPYHIINTHAILVNSGVSTYRQRGGDNFILSPLYCGSNATGWSPTEKFMGGKMTLATAMAISGAALNPNSGVGGKGLTRNKVLSLAMSLLNLRLSYWASHPARHVTRCPNHLRPGSYSFGNALGIPGTGFTEHRDYIQISDGGQFENMAVYELVRRRLDLIIVCDGGEDGGFTFSDLQTTVQRVWSDFGARITVNPHATPDQMIPLSSETGPVYPKDFCFADRGYMVCSIEYNDHNKGILLFLKTTLIRDVSFSVKGYAAQNRGFPDQSTTDQFFDEVQFESYRELGYQIALQMLEAPVPNGVTSTTAPQGTLEALIKNLGTTGSP